MLAPPPARALVRAPSAAFVNALSRQPRPRPPDLPRALEQHAAYRDGLRWLGLSVVALEADDTLADGCFVEDTALWLDGVALVTRPGAPSRRAELPSVRAALAPHARAVAAVTAPATLDGGDCLRVGRTFYVGRSGRTNAAGVEAVRAALGPLGFSVVDVPVGDELHLKCVASALDERRVLAVDGALPPGTFRDVEVVSVPREEAYAANCVAVGGRALVAAGFPRVQALLRRAGLETRALDLSEFRAADGALTCLSILF